MAGKIIHKIEQYHREILHNMHLKFRFSICISIEIMGVNYTRKGVKNYNYCSL